MDWSRSGFPMAAPVRRRAAPSAPSSGPEELIHVEGLLAFEQIIDGASQFMGEDGERLGLAVLGSELLHESLRGRVLAQKEHRGFREGPLQMRIADLGARGAEPFASGRLRALHQAGTCLPAGRSEGK